MTTREDYRKNCDLKRRIVRQSIEIAELESQVRDLTNQVDHLHANPTSRPIVPTTANNRFLADYLKEEAAQYQEKIRVLVDEANARLTSEGKDSEAFIREQITFVQLPD
jgi:hypothetical protein